MKKLIVIALFVSTFVLSPVAAFACACCAEKGEYYSRAQRPAATDLEIINALRFNDGVSLFTAPPEGEDIKGLQSIQTDYNAFDFGTDPYFFALNESFSARTFKFNFKTKTGKTGVLTLPLPAQMTKFGVDLHDAPAGQEVYELILQGRGNHCVMAENFTHWRLEVKGRSADYAFFGKLNS